jgi:hypothetical protein
MPRKQPPAKRQAARRKDPVASRGGKPREKALDALVAESDRQLDELIARRLALPVEQRMNFLRRRLPGGGSCL